MKKILLILFTLNIMFAFDLTFTQAFNNFNQGIKLANKNPILAQKKFKKAYKLLQSIKNKNSSQIYYMLGRMYCNGWGVKQDYKLAEKYFLKSLALGNKRTNCCIARLYFKIGKPYKAKRYLQKALSNKIIANYCNDLIQSNSKE